MLAQVAVSFVLLVGAGLMIRSFMKLREVNPGFQSERLLAMRVSANFSKYSTQPQFHKLYGDIQRAAASTPGVNSAARVLSSG